MDHVGVTGTRKGWTSWQGHTFKAILVALDPKWLHNGLAGGVDAQSARLAQELGIKVHGYPSTHGPDLAAQRISDALDDPAEPLVRDRTIVAHSECLVACPRGHTEELRSGTWATVRYARKAGLPIWICWLDGSLTLEEH